MIRRDSPKLQDEAVEISDAYFKRSYVGKAIPDRYKTRVYPLGLNYELYAGNLNRYEVSRFLFRKTILKRFPRILKRMAELVSLSFLPHRKYERCAGL